jgi:lipoprotein-anchoring transpeptidase ErfK/SrfK
MSAKIILDKIINCPKNHEGCWGKTSMGTLTYNGKTVICNGSGNRKYKMDITISPKDCFENKKSNEFNVNMPYAIGPVEWQTGVYIHQYPIMCSAGCIHLSSDDAKDFYNWAKKQTKVRILINSTY